jgi:delta 1-pyrroline-5-carboxylate dehydrogenase
MGLTELDLHVDVNAASKDDTSLTPKHNVETSQIEADDAVLHHGTEEASDDTNGLQHTEVPLQFNVPSLINGIEETGPSTFDVISPYTNTTCWTSTSASPADALRAVDSASAAFTSWSQTKPTVRRDILLRAADILEARTEANAEIMRTEMGADVGTSQFFVVPLAIKMLRDVAGRITSICGSVPVVEEEGQSAIVYKEPMGVILGIVPW